jgi:membrane-associated protease RseP (regulator of RpoE activity)
MSKENRIILIQVALFITTFITTTFAGAEWVYGKSVLMEGYSWADFISGMSFSIPFLLILTVHEFGHYFTAIYHKVKTSLPYYIPVPPAIMLSFGTLGALIRLRERVPSLKKNFDIGIAGPLAGFVVALVIIIYGFITLPPPEYVFQFHPEYETYGLAYADHVYKELESETLDVVVGGNLLFSMLQAIFADPARVPNPHELMHYPLLFAGFLSLVFTSLNLLPIGQLDGGHVLYGLVGFKRHRIIASVVYLLFMFYAGLGLTFLEGNSQEEFYIGCALYVGFLYFCFKGLMLSRRDTIMYAVLMFALQYLLYLVFPHWQGSWGWLLFGFVIGRFVGIPHPPAEIEEPLDPARQALGWIALLILILSFSPDPLSVTIVP